MENPNIMGKDSEKSQISLGKFTMLSKVAHIFKGHFLTKLKYIYIVHSLFSSAVPSGRGAFQMPTRPSSAVSAASSTLRGRMANLRTHAVTFSFFCMKLLWDDINNIS